VNPAHNQITVLWRVPVVMEVAALILKLNEHVLPSLFVGVNTALSFAVWIIRSDRLYEETEFSAYHSKNIYDALLIDGSET
jgi:hypothetical protein